MVGARDSGGPPGCGGRFKASDMAGRNTGGAKSGASVTFRPGGGVMPGGGGSKSIRGDSNETRRQQGLRAKWQLSAGGPEN